MNLYLDAQRKGVAFSWCCTKKQMFEALEIPLVSKWKLAVLKWKHILLSEEMK